MYLLFEQLLSDNSKFSNLFTNTKWNKKVNKNPAIEETGNFSMYFQKWKMVH